MANSAIYATLPTMPRQPRLDAPGVLHHVMVRGIERRPIFRDDTDRADFVARLGALATAGALTVYAWALLPNHAHFLVRTGTRPLSRSLRSLLTGYAGAFNRRHKRVGHLFQNRYKSIVVEEDRYLLELVRYLHLNPLRAGVVPTLAALARYPWSGHSALLGWTPRPWQATTAILGHFAARAGYRAFVAEGVPQGRRPELQGGGPPGTSGRGAGPEPRRLDGRGRPPPGAGGVRGRRAGPRRASLRGGSSTGRGGARRGVAPSPRPRRRSRRRGGRRGAPAGRARRHRPGTPGRAGPGGCGLPLVSRGRPVGARLGSRARALASGGVRGCDARRTCGRSLANGVEGIAVIANVPYSHVPYSSPIAVPYCSMRESVRR
ncbi:MAG: transposase [candidate division NC10 bacterium]|nr:transposase [candidate division NC10 bacterium]